MKNAMRYFQKAVDWFIRGRGADQDVRVYKIDIALNNEEAKRADVVFSKIFGKARKADSIFVVNVDLHYSLYDRLRVIMDCEILPYLDGYSRIPKISEYMYEMSRTRLRAYCFMDLALRSTVIVVPRLDIGNRAYEIQPYIPTYLKWFIPDGSACTKDEDTLFCLAHNNQVLYREQLDF